jgi:hypothetical protein
MKFVLPKDIDPDGDKSERIKEMVNEEVVVNGRNGFDAIYQIAKEELGFLFEEQLDDIYPDIEYGKELFIGL